MKYLFSSRGKQIACSVVLFHLLAVFSLLGNHLFRKRSTPPRPMVVKTIRLEKPIAFKQERIQQPAATQTQSPPRKEAPQKPKVAAAIKPAPKKEGVTKKAEPPKELAKSPESWAVEKAPKRPSLSLPKPIETQPQPQKESKEEPTYGEFLIAYLQNTLDLPEYGSVKAKIEIDRFGRLIDCEIVEAKSLKNAEFLKNQLPDLTFPCLNDFGILETAQTFTITFSNVETR